MPPRQRDLAFETLVSVTKSNVAMERGKLNAALAAIKEAWHNEGGMPADLPREIELRAQAYRRVMPKMMLTSTSLASHWHRVMDGESTKSAQQQIIDELKGEEDDP